MSKKHGRRPILHALSRQNRHLQEFDRDDYSHHEKFLEPTACPKCGAVFQNGRWQWSPPPLEAHRTICPACIRTMHKLAAGELMLHGDYLQRHRDDILGLVRNVEAREKAEHPLSRIIDIERREGDAVIVHTTTMSLARALGTAVEHAHRGMLSYRYHDDNALLRMEWQRFV